MDKLTQNSSYCLLKLNFSSCFYISSLSFPHGKVWTEILQQKIEIRPEVPKRSGFSNQTGSSLKEVGFLIRPEVLKHT